MNDDPPHPIQFSMRGIFLAMVLAAVIAAIGRSLKPSWEILASIYLLAPLGLVLFALLPYRISWQHRCVILTPAAMAIIGVAMFIGSRIGVDFDKVLMGIFICWTPQSALAAIGLLAVIYHAEAKKLARQ
jgi:hypothetical protein